MLPGALNRQKLELEKQRFEFEKRFFHRNFGAIISLLVGLSTAMNGFLVVRLTTTQNEAERTQKEAESNLNALRLVLERQPDIFEESDRIRRDRYQRIIAQLFPKPVATVLLIEFSRLSQSPEALADSRAVLDQKLGYSPSSEVAIIEFAVDHSPWSDALEIELKKTGFKVYKRDHHSQAALSHPLIKYFVPESRDDAQIVATEVKLIVKSPSEVVLNTDFPGMGKRIEVWLPKG
jgi:hypothetical protein